MLDQFADVAGEDFPVVGLVRPSGQVAAMAFRPGEDRGAGPLRMGRGLQPTWHVAVVGGAQGDLGGLNGPLVDGQFSDDVLRDAWIEAAGGRAPSVLDRERRGGGPVAGEERKELRLAEAQHGPDIGAFNRGGVPF